MFLLNPCPPNRSDGKVMRKRDIIKIKKTKKTQLHVGDLTVALNSRVRPQNTRKLESAMLKPKERNWQLSDCLPYPLSVPFYLPDYFYRMGEGEIRHISRVDALS